MLENIKQYKIILASNSPRRSELLRGLGIDFEVKTIKGIDESYPDHLKGEDIPKFISLSKALAYKSSMKSDEMIITADTIVYVNGIVLGKPTDSIDAYNMLKELSGKCHEVITGVTILTSSQTISFSTTSKVCFSELNDEEINYYIEKYKPYDKAGAYGIQEWIGYIGVSKIEGSYFNVMGLPVQRLYTELKSIK